MQQRQHQQQQQKQGGRASRGLNIPTGCIHVLLISCSVLSHQHFNPGSASHPLGDAHRGALSILFDAEQLSDVEKPCVWLANPEVQFSQDMCCSG